VHAPNPHRPQPASPKKGLTLKTIQTLVQAAQPGMWAHERGLCLAVAKSGSAFWALRYPTGDGRRRLMTLQPYQPIDAAGLKALEWQAAELRKLIKAGRDPLAERDADAAATATAATTVNRIAVDTFEEVARDYIAQHKDGWKNAKHFQQWENTLEHVGIVMRNARRLHSTRL
jgi:Arm DNA-binding domain